jgi:hypothetical protein
LVAYGIPKTIKPLAARGTVLAAHLREAAALRVTVEALLLVVWVEAAKLSPSPHKRARSSGLFCALKKYRFPY